MAVHMHLEDHCLQEDEVARPHHFAEDQGVHHLTEEEEIILSRGQGLHHDANSDEMICSEGHLLRATSEMSPGFGKDLLVDLR